MDPAALEAAIEADIAAGHQPSCVSAAIGTTGSSAIDPLPAIAEICARHGIWLHVDAAWAGAALILPEHRWMIDGIESADSLVINPHKWLFTNFDCSAYFVRDAGHLVRTFGLTAEYLRTNEDRRVNNYRDWGIPLGRRFRALKLWFVIRAYGADGLRRRIARHMELARDLERSIDDSADFEMLAPVPLALLCFRHRPPGVADGEAVDRLNQALVERLNATGKLFLTHTRLGGAYAVRLSIGQTTTEARHVDAAWRLIQDTARTLV
jgi:aromatic-L-amino-acid decarboxylase